MNAELNELLDELVNLGKSILSAMEWGDPYRDLEIEVEQTKKRIFEIFEKQEVT